MVKFVGNSDNSAVKVWLRVPRYFPRIVSRTCRHSEALEKLLKQLSSDFVRCNTPVNRGVNERAGTRRVNEEGTAGVAGTGGARFPHRAASTWWRWNRRGEDTSPYLVSIFHARWFVLCLVLLTAPSSFAAVTFKALNSFVSAKGAQPFGELLRSTNGLFYGTTASGGVNGLGAIYSATTGGALNPIASFDGTNGAQPLAGLAQGLDSRFYGTASAGGLYGQGTIFVATADGTLTNLYSFDGTNGARPLAPLTLAPLTLGGDGNFYGTTSAGGGFNLGPIFMVTPAGEFTLLYSFT